MSSEPPPSPQVDRPSREKLREQLASEIGSCVSSDLHAHLTRDVVLVVAPELQLLDVATAVATDDPPTVQGWIRAAQLRKPTQQEFSLWSQEKALPFRVVIVRPYVLVQVVSPS